MNLILFGFKSCGKTHFGKLLASQTNKRFIDTDRVIEDLFEKQACERLTCRQIAQTKGESVFRELEKQAVLSLQGIDNAVISLGGGAILDLDNQRLLNELGKLIFLDIDKETLMTRLFAQELPSFLDKNDPISSFEKMYAARLPMYEQVPAVRVVGEKKTEREILQELKRLTHGE